MEQNPPIRLGLLFGLGMILVLALLDIGLVTLVFTTPISLLSVIRALAVLLTLPVIGVTLYGLFGLNNASYLVDRNAIEIRWGRVVQVIPLGSIEGIRKGEGLGRVTRFRGIRWSGFWLGRGRITGLGAVQFYCSAPLARQLLIQTPSGSYAISPENPDRFMDLVATQKEMGPSEPVEQVMEQPAIGHRGLFSDRTGVTLAAAGGGLNLLLYFFLAAQYGRLPHTLPLHFDLTGAPDRFGNTSFLFGLIALGTVAWLLNGFLATAAFRWLREQMVAYLLLGGAVGLQILLWIAVIGLVRI